MNCDPHWTAYVSAVVIPIIALIGAWIAFRQSQIARNKLKLDLFEKRLAVYQVVREALGGVAAKGRLTQEQEFQYLVGIRSARWLFGSEVFDYLDKTLWHEIVEIGLHQTMMDSPQSEERNKHIVAHREAMQWFLDQYKVLDGLCDKYLSLSH